jgi:hypothetical protein
MLDAGMEGGHQHDQICGIAAEVVVEEREV